MGVRVNPYPPKSVTESKSYKIRTKNSTLKGILCVIELEKENRDLVEKINSYLSDEEQLTDDEIINSKDQLYDKIV